MLRGMYTAASGMLVDQRRMDVIANNLANVSTTGYKRETSLTESFHSFYVVRINDEEQARSVDDATNFVGKLGIGTLIAHTSTKFMTGPVKMTGNPLDVAIVGDGFFAVNTPNGMRFTRSGNFHQNAAGGLVTAEGYEVLVDGSPVSSADGMMRIDASGEVWVGERSLGKLTLFTSTDLGAIRKEGNGLWAVAGQGEPTAVVIPSELTGHYELRPGYLEQSNVEPISEMVEMITTMRTYEASQRALQAMDQTLEKVVTEVGRA